MRGQVSFGFCDDALGVIRIATKRRLEEKGDGGFASVHEALGVITEEYHELVRAIESDDRKAIHGELIDVVVACVFALASDYAGTMEWWRSAE